MRLWCYSFTETGCLLTDKKYRAGNGISCTGSIENDLFQVFFFSNLKPKCMRLLFLLLLISSNSFVQAQQISGFARDEAGPLAGATVSLIKAKDSSSVKFAVTKTDGSYSFSGIKEGVYKLQVTHVGYQTGYSDAFVFGSSFTVPDLKLVKASANLANINITTKKPMVEVKADKTILNVEGTINAAGTNAFELLRKSPGVMLDKDDNISLAGKNGVQVYIDGRSTPLSGQDLATYLKTMQSSQIEAIEIITNPSARYDAAGNAGIINIRLVKNRSLGTNGSVNAGLNLAGHTKYNAGGSLNFRNKKINIFSTYSYSYAPNLQHIEIRRTVADSIFDQRGTMLDTRRAHNFKAGADYFLNKKNTIGLMINGIISDPNSQSNTKTNISNTASSSPDRFLEAKSNNDMKRHNMNANLNYAYAGAKGKTLNLNVDKGFYDFNSDQFQANNHYDISGVKQGSIIYHMLSPAEINIQSLKADYEVNAGKGKLALGIKSAGVKTDNDFQRYDVNSSTETLDKDRSNHFLYKENINAAYANYNHQCKKMMMQVGVRAENTKAEGVSNGLKFNGSNYSPSESSFTRSYTDLFPSAAFSFNKNPLKVWSLSFSRRIDRPAYQDLNPFEFKLDEYTFMKGNVDLRPQYTNTIGLSHTYKYKLNVSLNYSHVKDMFTQIIDTIETTKAFVSKKNLATQDIINMGISYPFQYKSYNLFTSINTNYSKYKADFGKNRQVDLEAFGFNLFMQQSVKFAKTWTAELSGFFNAPTVYQGSFVGRSITNVDAGLSKQLMKGRAVAKASFSDVFNTMKFRARSDFAGQSMTFSYRQESQQLKFSMNIRFGNNKVKPARQRVPGAEDETKRVQSGSGGIGL
jgi:iron complex outermembrane recepter protein